MEYPFEPFKIAIYRAVPDYVMGGVSIGAR